jgi:hypothetical protein
MESIFGLLVLIADIYAIYNIWTSSEDTVKKVIWTLVVLVLPLIGVIIWYFAGPKSSG